VLGGEDFTPMQTQKQTEKNALTKELYVDIIVWAWIAAGVATLCFLIRAIVFHGSWWYFFGSLLITWLLCAYVNLWLLVDTENQSPGRRNQCQV
jgi:hypothetical protein